MYDPNKMHLEFNFQKEMHQTICLEAQVNTQSKASTILETGAPENKLAIEQHIYIWNQLLQKFDSILFLWLYGGKEELSSA